MPESKDSKYDLESSVGKKVALNTSFSCPSCASGAEKYSELFDHGTCVNCGAPLEQFGATLTETGEQEIKSSVLLIYSKEEMGDTAEAVISELKQNGINTINIYDIIDGSKTSVVSANLSFVMDKTAGVLVIPSSHLEDSPVISTCLNNAIVQKVEKSKNIIPIYTTENVSKKVPFGLTDIIGINWDGNVRDRRAFVDKSRAIGHIRQFIDENTSK